MPRNEESYDRYREEMRERSREQSEHGRKVPPTRPPLHPRIKKGASRDFARFCRNYFPFVFHLPFSQDHKKVIGKIETSVLRGGLFAVAMPRGFGKTSLCEAACLWALLYGHRRFVVLIGADEGAAGRMLESIKRELETNERLQGDFDEVCGPVAALERMANRCRGQLTPEGEPTYIEWAAKNLVLPMMPNSAASGAVVMIGGLTASLRGLKFKRPDGQSVRPDLVIIDDPQTDESAASPSQCAYRERIISGAILGMAGPGRKIAGIMPCTVVAPNDLADNMLDPQKHPAWRGERTRLVYSMPTNEGLWEEYAELRRESLRNERGGAEATAFYKAHRLEMDEGATVAWPQRHEEDEISGIQYAMNIKIDRPAVFRAEYQNDPEPLEKEAAGALQVVEVTSRLNHHSRALVPLGIQCLTAFVDVQQTLLWWAVCGWGEGFTGYVVDYGGFPDQKRSYFSLADARPTISQATGIGSLEGSIWAALDQLTAKLLARDWVAEGGALLRVERCLVDFGWGETAELVKRFCRQNTHASVLLPSKGIGISASMRPMSDWPRKPGERRGFDWIVPAPERGRGKYLLFDANSYKSFLAARLRQPMGEPGALTLFGDDAEAHRMLADHVCSEYPVRTKGRNRELDEWKQRATHPDNHLLDCYDEKTEVLTRDGWALFSGVTYEDEFATVNLETDLIEYQRPTHLIARHYSGEMVQIGGGPGQRVNLCVTPGHRMVVFAGQAGRGPVFKTAGELTIWDKIKTHATWEGDGRTTYTIPATRQAGDSRRGHPEAIVSAIDLAAFLGWWIAEGSCRVNHAKGKGRTHVVVISQIPGEKQDAICAILDRLPWRYHVAKNGVVISNQQAYKLVSVLGDKYTKRVPQWIKDAPPEVICEFIRCAVDGDGWRQRGSESYATVSHRLADDMQELYLKIGVSSSLKVRAPVAYCIRGRVGTNTVEQYYVHRNANSKASLRDGENRPNFGRVDYHGMVFCASVPNTTLIVRRGGKVAICGNCLVGCCVGAAERGQALGVLKPTGAPRSAGPRKTLQQLQAENRLRHR